LISKCRLCIAVLSFGGCQIAIEEKDIFQPGSANGVEFTIETADGALFVLNKPRAGLFEQMGVVFDEMMLPSNAGAIYPRLARGPDAEQPLIIYCGGNTWDTSVFDDVTAWSVAPFGDVALWDYPGFGRSTGEPSVAGFEEASLAVLQTIEQLKRSPDQKIVFWGHSLGGFDCADMAAKAENAAGLILMTSAPSANAAARYLAPWVLRPFVRVRLAQTIAEFDNVRALEGFNAPILIISAGKDEILPAKLSRKLRYALTAAGHRVDYAEFPKSDHFTIIREKELGPVIRSFLLEASEEGVRP